MNRYQTIYEDAEEDKVIKLDDESLVDKIVEWFIANPYPQDHSGLHKFAESLGLEADILETYIYAFVSCFLSGGNYNKKKADATKFDQKEIDMGMLVEAEHVDTDNTNPVVKKIADTIRKRISYDHLADNKTYYSDAKAGKLKIEEL